MGTGFAADLQESNRQEAQMGERKHKKRMILSFAALAIFCILGAELMACRVAEPALYEEIVAPVRRGAEALRRTGEAAWEGVCQTGSTIWTGVRETATSAAESLGAWWEEVTAPPPEDDVALALAEPELTPPRELLDPLVSDIITRNGVEYLTGGGVDIVYYAQTDEARAEQKYGTDPLSTHGCGPTAMAMAVSSLTDTTVDPEEMARVCVDGGYWCKGHGSYLSIVQGVAKTYGLECEALDPAALNEDALLTRLTNGEVAVALVGSGHFTKNGHFILLRGVTLGGDILVADPASRDRSLIPWELSLILDELSPSRTNGAPLWILSRSMDAPE